MKGRRAAPLPSSLEGFPDPSGPRPGARGEGPNPLFQLFQALPGVLDALLRPQKLLLQTLLVGPDQAGLHDGRDAAGLTGDLVPNVA